MRSEAEHPETVSNPPSTSERLFADLWNSLNSRNCAKKPCITLSRSPRHAAQGSDRASRRVQPPPYTVERIHVHKTRLKCVAHSMYKILEKGATEVGRFRAESEILLFLSPQQGRFWGKRPLQYIREELRMAARSSTNYLVQVKCVLIISLVFLIL